MKGEAEGDVREDTGGHKKGYVRRNVKRPVCRKKGNGRGMRKGTLMETCWKCTLGTNCALAGKAQWPMGNPCWITDSPDGLGPGMNPQ